MIQFASMDCAINCPNLLGRQVNDVCEVLREGGEESDSVVLVEISGRSETPASVPLRDLGGDSNEHYLKAVRKCTGPLETSGSGLFKRKTFDCQAMLGQYSLTEYKA